MAKKKKKTLSLLSQEKRKFKAYKERCGKLRSLQLPFPTPPQKFNRSAKPQIPQNMTILNYKVKVLILHLAIGSARRKHYRLC